MPRGITNHGQLRWQARKDAEAAATEQAVLAKVKRRNLQVGAERFVAYDADSLLEVTSYHGRPGHLW